MTYREGVPETEAVGSVFPDDTTWTAYRLIAPGRLGVRLGPVRASTQKLARERAAELYAVNIREIEAVR